MFCYLPPREIYILLIANQKLWVFPGQDLHKRPKSSEPLRDTVSLIKVIQQDLTFSNYSAEEVILRTVFPGPPAAPSWGPATLGRHFVSRKILRFFSFNESKQEHLGNFQNQAPSSMYNFFTLTRILFKTPVGS
jgi:hypothetical protein